MSVLPILIWCYTSLLILVTSPTFTIYNDILLEMLHDLVLRQLTRMQGIGKANTCRISYKSFIFLFPIRELVGGGKCQTSTPIPLIMLPNRSLFYEHLDRDLRRALRNIARGAVFFLDLDRFKAVNDQLGHSKGDQLL